MKKIDINFDDWDEDELENSLYVLKIINSVDKSEFLTGTMKNEVIIKLGWNNSDDVHDILRVIVGGSYSVTSRKNYPDESYDDFKSYQIIRVFNHIDRFNELYKKWI